MDSPLEHSSQPVAIREAIIINKTVRDINTTSAPQNHNTGMAIAAGAQETAQYMQSSLTLNTPSEPSPGQKKSSSLPSFALALPPPKLGKVGHVPVHYCTVLLNTSPTANSPTRWCHREQKSSCSLTKGTSAPSPSPKPVTFWAPFPYRKWLPRQSIRCPPLLSLLLGPLALAGGMRQYQRPQLVTLMDF